MWRSASLLLTVYLRHQRGVLCSGGLLSLAVTAVSDDIIPAQSHTSFTLLEGVRTYLQSCFSYTWTAVAAWGWDGEWVLITEAGGNGEGTHRATEREHCKYSNRTFYHRVKWNRLDRNNRLSHSCMFVCRRQRSIWLSHMLMLWACGGHRMGWLCRRCSENNPILYHSMLKSISNCLLLIHIHIYLEFFFFLL